MAWHEGWLVDEAWLRVRRLVHTGIRDMGLDLRHPIIGERVQYQLACGARALAGELGIFDRPSLAAFEAARQATPGMSGWFAGMPLRIGIAYDMAHCLLRLSGGPPEGDQSPLRAIVLLHLAICTFDAAVDELSLKDRIFGLVDAGTLDRLLERPGEAPALRERLRDDDAPLLGLFVAVFVGFFFEYQALASRIDGDLFRQALTASYRAQADSLSADKNGKHFWNTSLQKSRFVYRSYAALLPSSDRKRSDRVMQMASVTGEAFAVLDDLADVARDAGAGHANGVLARAEVDRNLEPAAQLRSLLETTAIDQAAHELLEQLKDIAESLGGDGMEPQAVAYSQWLFAVTAYWLQ